MRALLPQSPQPRKEQCHEPCPARRRCGPRPDRRLDAAFLRPACSIRKRQQQRASVQYRDRNDAGYAARSTAPPFLAPGQVRVPPRPCCHHLSANHTAARLRERGHATGQQPQSYSRPRTPQSGAKLSETDEQQRQQFRRRQRQQRLIRHADGITWVIAELAQHTKRSPDGAPRNPRGAYSPRERPRISLRSIRAAKPLTNR